MTLSLQEACIFHLYNVNPGETVRYRRQWDLVTACEYHKSMTKGNRQERLAAATLTVLQVFDTLQEFFSRPSNGSEDDVQGAYTMDVAMYERLLCYLREEGE